MDRRDVVHVRFEPELRVKRQPDLTDVDEEVDRVVVAHLRRLAEKPEGSDLSDAVAHASRLVALLDSGEAEDALLGDASGVVVEDLLVRAGLVADAVAAAAFLVDEHDAVLRSLVDRLARAGLQARGVGAVVAHPGQVEEPHVVRQREVVALHRDRHVDLVLAAVRVCVVHVGGGPADVLLPDRCGLEDGLARVRVAVPVLGAEQVEFSCVPREGVGAPWFGLDVVPQHVLLAVARRPAGLARHGAGLAADALVRVEHRRCLALRARLLIRVLHRAVQLPVEHLRHCFPLLLRCSCRPGTSTSPRSRCPAGSPALPGARAPCRLRRRLPPWQT